MPTNKYRRKDGVSKSSMDANGWESEKQNIYILKVPPTKDFLSYKREIVTSQRSDLAETTVTPQPVLGQTAAGASLGAWKEAALLLWLSRLKGSTRIYSSGSTGTQTEHVSQNTKVKEDEERLRDCSRLKRLLKRRED